MSEDSKDSDDWEAVESANVEDEEDQLPVASTPVEIDVPLDGSAKKVKKKDLEALLLARLKRKEKEMNVDIHKVHVLCCLTHGFYLNDTIGHNVDLLGTALSQWSMPVVQKICQDTNSIELDARRLHLLVQSIKGNFPLKDVKDDVTDTTNTVADLKRALVQKRCGSYLHQVLITVLMLRCLGLDVRLIYSMQPRPVMKLLQEKPASRNTDKSSGTVESPYFSGKGPSKPSSSKATQLEPSKKAKTFSKTNGSTRTSGGKKSVSDADEDFEPVPKKLRSSASTPSKSPSKNKIPEARTPTSTLRSASQRSTPKKSSVSSKLLVGGFDYWIDVYCSRLKSYVAVSQSAHVDGANQHTNCEKSATQPVHYVVAFGEKNEAKDVTAMFSSDFLTNTRKLQADPGWWKKTLSMFRPGNLLRDADEDDAIRELLLKRPLPKSVQEYKGHPLYVLERHLLKYEALYPPNTAPVHKIRNEPVYLKELVHSLKTRENWLKEARVIKLGEKPYKEVRKAKRGHKKISQLAALAGIPSTCKEESSGLFGRWQTEDYTPPVAENGIVPRNEHGNVDMFKPSMLPIGCAHIHIKDIHKVAKRLNIDCAAAMIGWDFAGGHCHPVMDGWIVCQEYEETLLDAWNNQQFKVEEEEKEAKSKKAIDNWRRLIRNLRLRRDLERKYGSAQGGASEERKKPPEPEVIEIDSDGNDNAT
ncbi:hypothetical protein RvY_05493-2 [Ramazzottius varieornatus]|uniref:Rad4 beta-hairpin domain-containing protein n=1 Tax=Ramazzottius varieornatus TaxID=947166 RepID=A0A1D1V527_RAMVA|nr:hypothetical protein RvY_05493-2 [Ramazzottius varieornatus]